ncbi:MAG: outer membrane protein [Thermoproteota archaeon]|jgi:outer membrane protein
MKVLITVIFTFITFAVSEYSHASFKNLREEFLKRNYDLKIAKLDKKSFKNTFDNYSTQYDWGISLGLGYDDDKPAALFPFQQVQTIDQYISLGTSKSFKWGGDLTISQTIIKYDLSNWSSPPFDDGTGVEYELSYTQDIGKDFFGRNSKLSIENNDYQFQYNMKQVEQSRQSAFMDFYLSYLRSKLEKTILSLTEQALDRAEKRINSVQKRYSDGLSRKIDLLQAKVSYKTQKENKLKSINSQNETYFKLSKIMNRKIEAQEIKSFKLDVLKSHNAVNGSVLENIKLKSLNDLKKMAENSLRIAENNLKPDIQLTTSYTMNSISEEASDSFSDAVPGGDNYEKSISLAITYPFGNKIQKINKSQKSISLNKQKLLLEKYKNELNHQDQSIQERLKFLSEKMAISHEKRDLAQQAIKEQNRLYKIGKSDLDPVIKLEELLIQTEVSLANNLFAYEALLVEDAFLKGKVLELINTYSE